VRLSGPQIIGLSLVVPCPSFLIFRPKKEMATKVTQAQVIEALKKNRGTMYLAAKELGITARSIHNYCKRWPKVRETIEAQQGELKDIAEVALHQAIRRGEAWAICFYLKTKAKDRGYSERFEYTGKDGGPIEQSHVDRLTADERRTELLRIIADLRQARDAEQGTPIANGTGNGTPLGAAQG
jgi:hypothetical protein